MISSKKRGGIPAMRIAFDFYVPRENGDFFTIKNPAVRKCEWRVGCWRGVIALIEFLDQ